MHVKALEVFEEVFDGNKVQAQKKAQMITEGQMCRRLAKMGANANYKLGSQREIRHGYMSFVVKLSNKFISRKDIDDLYKNCAEEFGCDEWKEFTGNELAKSNSKDNVNLGGVSRPNHGDNDSDDDENSIEVNMESIMSRFNTYSQ